mgnify:CR=1 FL=1
MFEEAAVEPPEPESWADLEAEEGEVLLAQQTAPPADRASEQPAPASAADGVSD